MLMNKYVKWGAGIAILLPVALFFILAFLLYFPPFQRWAVKQTTSYASAKTGMEISIDRVALAFPLDLSLEGFKMIRPNDSLPQTKDTVAAVGDLVVDVRLWPLLHRQVAIDALEFNRLKVNTADLIHSLRIQGSVGRLALHNKGCLDWAHEAVDAAELQLSDAKLDVALSDTVTPDTAKSTSNWKVRADRMRIRNTDFVLHMPGDTLQVRAYMGEALAQEADLELGKGRYRIRLVDWKQGQVNYDNNFAVRLRDGAIDFNHLALTDLTLLADSFSYADSRLDIRIREGRFCERSGFQVTRLAGAFGLDSARMWLPDMQLATPESSLSAELDMDLNAFADQSPGKMKATLHGSFGKQDLMRFFTDMPVGFRRQWPNYPLRVDGVVRGNMEKVRFTGVNVALPTAFRLSADGFAEHLTDPKRLKADVNLNARTYQLGFVTAMLSPSLRRQVRIPSPMALRGRLNMDGSRYGANFIAQEGKGSLRGRAVFDAGRMAYEADLVADRLQLQHFLPGQGLHAFSGKVVAKGGGTDLMSPRTRLDATADIHEFQYGNYQLDQMKCVATVRNGRAFADITSHNRLLQGQISLDALLSRRSLDATIVCDLAKADLYHLRLLDQPMVASLCGHVDVKSNLRDFYMVQGSISDMTFTDSVRSYRPEDIVMDVFTRRDTTHAVIDCGDFSLRMNARGGYERLLSKGSALWKEVRKQQNDRYIDQVRLRERLPLAKIYLRSGNDNFFCRMLKRYNCELANIFIDMDSSPQTGLNGRLKIDSLSVSDVLLDTIRLNIKSDSTRTTYHAQVRNNRQNPQYVFNALLDGALNERGAFMTSAVYDEHDKLGVRLGVSAEMEQGGIRLRMFGDDPILGYKQFAVNDSNYVFFADDRRISANLKLLAKDGTGVQVYSDDGNLEALQDITVSLNKFDLQKVLSVIPYTPDISGVMDGDFHLIKTADALSVSSDMSIKNMYYEKCPMGNVGIELVYMPKDDGQHYVDGILKQDDREVATLTGTYQSKGDGYLDGEIGMEHLPLSMLNGFIPDQIIGFRGVAEGSLQIKGTLSAPQINGEAYLDSAYLVSIPYGVEMRFANDPVRIVGSHLLFENFEMFANNDSPLNVSGFFDFSDLNRMAMDVKMQARNFEIINAKENPRSEAYGQAFIDFFGIMRGPVSSLQMRGRVNVLGNTDMVYVMRDSELATDTQLNDLVKFTDFRDTTSTVINRPPLTGFDMSLSLNIDESAHILCMLNADHTNYIDLMGGGDLRMSYNTTDNLQLVGRYTLNNGEMKYSLPVIPLKTFNIQDGSYIEFRGDPLDPMLNITATESVKASVDEGTGTGRSVDFNCGVKLTQTLTKPGVEFIIEAPNDMSVQDELNTMTVEGRGKVAVTMLASGMYLADGNTSSFSMNSALSSFLQTEINNITGTALRSMGLDLGMSVNNSVTSTGGLHTDYNFRFAKRLWNNRLSVIVGGKVSTGEEIDERDNNAFFNNMELEYRIDQKSSKYLRLFYNNNTYDWLEGRIGEYGAGFMWRRKLRHFKDIFRFSNDQDLLPPIQANPKDSLKNENK